MSQLLQYYLITKGTRNLVFVLSILLCMQSVSAQIKYVTPTGAGLKNGSSWANAYSESELWNVLDTTSSGKQIWVAAGTYRPTTTYPAPRELYFNIHSGVSVYGGFAGNETNLNQRNPRVNSTIFSGNINDQNSVEDNSYHVVVFDNVAALSILDGITVKNGNANNASNAITRMGGGIYVKGGQAFVKITNCTISENKAITGGGIGIEENARPIIESCLIQNNNANMGGGLSTLAENFYSIDASIVKTFFINNNSTDGLSAGAAFNLAGGTGVNTTSYTNCVFSGNNVSNTHVGGIIAMNFGNACSINITNCTFFNNGQGDNSTGKSFHYINNIGGTIHNSIFWNNGSLNITPYPGPPNIDFKNNIIQEGFIPNTITITANPNFLNESSISGTDGIFGTIDDGLNISCVSPAKDAGLSTGAPNTDILGTTRPQDGGIDLGAYESLPPALSISITVSRKSVCSNSLITFTAKALNAGFTPVYQWKKNGVNIGSNSSIFVYDNWSDNDSISCEITSPDPCLLVHTAISNKIRIRTSQPIYVNANATGANDGTSWEDAYTSLQTAFTYALPCTQEIWVAKGVYKPSQNKDGNSTGPTDRTNTFKLPNINVYGGFKGNETSLSERDAFGNLTILSGDLDNNDLNADGDYINENIVQIQGSNAYNVVTIDGAPVPMTLDGFVITGGNADVVSQSSNTTFPSNKGGGISIINSSSNPGLNLKIANCLISGNSAYYNGGGIMADSGKFILENSILTNNSGGYGGGIHADESYMQLKNVIFYQNKADVGGGLSNIHNSGGSANHCVFYQNWANTGTGGGINMAGAYSGLFMVRNSILWENYGEPIKNTYPESAIALSYCNINSFYPGDGNIWALPGFQNVNDLDGPDNKWGTSDDGLKLACNSELIDKASSPSLLTDIIGTPRPYYSAPDIGAYEYIPTSPSISITASASTLCETSIVTLTPTIKEAFGLMINYKWVKNGIEDGNAPTYQSQLFDGDDIYCTITTTNACAASLATTSNNITLKGYSFPVIYVDAEASAKNGGNSWPYAKNNLQSAINLAGSCPNKPQIWVKSGTYYPSAYPNGVGSSERDFTFALKDSLAIYGGFIGGEIDLSQRSLYSPPTILSGDVGIKANNADNCYHVVISVNTNNTAILDGFIIKDGNANGSGSIDISGKSIYRYGGGGIFTAYSDAQFSNCIIKQNKAFTHGGGIYFDYGAPTLTNTVITDNIVTTGNGGGLFAYSSAHTTTNCVFDYNRAGTYGGGLYQLFSSSVIRNSTFYNNYAITDGGGIYHDNSSASIINCIVWGNTGGGTKGIKGVYYGPFVSYSNVQESFSGTGNINSNPLFYNTNDIDGPDNIWKTMDDGLQLICKSPAINTGTNTNAPDKDIANATRPLFSTVDMGAYESRFFTPPPVVYGNVTIDPGQTLNLEASGVLGTLIKWYSSATATTTLSTNQNFLVSPATNTTYYVTATYEECESSRLAVPVVVTLCMNNPVAPNYAANANATLKSRNVMTASNTIGTNAKVNYQAEKSITLGPGFSTASGTIFKATIQACN